MVTGARIDRRGLTTLGCLVSMLILAAAGYYAFHIGEVYFRYYQLEDAMDSEARLAPGLKDDVIYRRLAARSDSVLGRVLTFYVQRTDRITIQTEYRDSVNLPFFRHTFHFRPKAEQPL